MDFHPVGNDQIILQKVFPPGSCFRDWRVESDSEYSVSEDPLRGIAGRQAVGIFMASEGLVSGFAGGWIQSLAQSQKIIFGILGQFGYR